jgi:signal transduction histidine kinase
MQPRNAVATRDDPAAEERRLRACARDLVAISTMPALWIGRPTAAVADGLRDLLGSALHADAVYVRLHEPEAGETRTATAGVAQKEIAAALEGAPTPMPLTPLFVGDRDSPLRVATAWIGVQGDFGILAVGAWRTDFPNDFESLLMQVAANQATVALRHTGLLRRHERAEQIMRRAVESRDRAIGIVSHDLGNLLSTIQICASALLDPEPPPVSEGRNVARLIQRSSTLMQQIVQDLLDRASLDAGQLALEWQSLAARDVLNAAEFMFTPLAHERRIEFIVECAPNLSPIEADPRRLQQVLSNLLSNAMKFTPAGGRVVLSVSASRGVLDDPRAPDTARDAVRFAVSDTGPGIPPEDCSHVFDWFWHARRQGRNGTGLGLAIAKGLIEAHHGRLYLESVVGKGSTFWFALPCPRSAAGVS